ncbi:MAG: hypothetical protein A4S09_03635 [Proteobacteria bacterium SG_bin7]|nr:MAG: hypothetical protein A4S09_03635 [Proteobacteria bacterium SG_bin7]
MKFNQSAVVAATEYLSDSQEMLAILQSDVKGFLELALLLKGYAGINLASNPKNHSLMATRLMSLMKSHKIAKYGDLVKRLKTGDEVIKRNFVQSLTTNTTHFFRENAHFSFLTSVLPEILARKKAENSRELRIWCGAASTGQEVYSILLTILEFFGDSIKNWDFRFLATDIDLEVLQKASKAVYSEKEIEGVPVLMRQKYFRKLTKVEGTLFQILPDFQKFVRFAPLNLVDEPYPFKGNFDIIFCRNVLIYFDPQTAHRVVENALHFLTPEGLLFLGHSESGAMRSKDVKTLSHAVYKKLRKM